MIVLHPLCLLLSSTLHSLSCSGLWLATVIYVLAWGCFIVLAITSSLNLDQCHVMWNGIWCMQGTVIGNTNCWQILKKKEQCISNQITILIVHSGMLHINLCYRIDTFFHSHLCTNFRICTNTFHYLSIYFSLLSFRSKNKSFISFLFSPWHQNVPVCGFGDGLCSLSCVSRFFFFSRSCRTSKKSAQNGGAASALMGGTKRSQSSTKAISFLR
jgi:hypothetical protein